MNDSMSTEGFSSSFRVEAPPDEVWRRLVATQPPDRAQGQWWVPGFEAPGTELECREGETLRIEKLVEPCAGTLITVTLVAEGAATTVTVTQSGFGDRWAMRDVLATGWAHIVADLALCLQRGVRGRRHIRPWSSLGATFAESAAGPLVTWVAPESPAERAGLTAGDVIVACGDAPVATIAELEAILRSHRGARVTIEWVHDAELFDREVEL